MGNAGPQRRRVLHAAPADPRDDPGGEADRSASASTTAPAARPASSARRSNICAATGHLDRRHGHAAARHLLRQGEEEPRLRDRHDEHDPARDRGAQHRPHQHARREHHRHPGEGPLRRGARQPALRRQGAPGNPAELSDQDRRDGVPVPAALHQVAARRRPRRHRDQEHLPVATPTTPAWHCARSCWRAATCTRSSIAAAAPSRARA